MQSNLFGQFLLERGTIDSDQLKLALDYQRAHNRVLGELALEMGLLDEDAISRIIKHQRLVDKDFGGVAVELDLMTEDSLNELLNQQQRVHLRLGDVLVKIELLSKVALKLELEAFEGIRTVGAAETFLDEQSFKENPALGFFNVVSRVLPRMTRGMFLPGGFYPTIAYSNYEYGFSQRVRGDLDMEAVFIISSEIFSLLGGSIILNSGQISESRSKVQYERSIKSLVNIIMRLFIQQQVRFGLRLELPASARKINENVFLKRKKKVRSTNNVEVFLLSPPDPSGDLLNFYISTIFR
jgi:hypothetical protein